MLLVTESTDRHPLDPTPEEIHERAAEIRQGWSEQVRARRRTMVVDPWLPPLVMTIALLREADSRRESA